MDVYFSNNSPGTTTIVALESVGSKIMIRKKKSTSQGEFNNRIDGHSTYNRHQR